MSRRGAPQDRLCFAHLLETLPDATVAITHQNSVPVVASAIRMLTFDRRPRRLEHASTAFAHRQRRWILSWGYDL